MSFRAACVRTTATTDIAHDIGVLSALIRKAAGQGPSFVATPEYCAGLDTRDRKVFPVAFEEAEQPVLPAMQALAATTGPPHERSLASVNRNAHIPVTLEGSTRHVRLRSSGTHRPHRRLPRLGL